ncbi:MAG: DMP19 family protein [Alphaproteobacteria bacterium]|nr:DMP19 family protein [Alphaproteobacteria bacterium]
MNSYDDPKAFLDQFAHLPEPSKHLFAAEALVSEVANGGFSQLFLNSTGVLAPEGVKGLKAIGMPQAAAIAEEAMAWFGSDYPRDYYVRNDALAAFEEAHGDHDDADCPICTIDDRFYAVMSDENGGFEDAANQFAKRHAG